MEDMLSISVVVYKCYDDTLKLVESIEQHTNEKIKKTIYIIDNSCYSQNDQVNFANSLKCYRDVEYIDVKSNLGFGKGHNYIISELKSKYHAIVNPDIVLNEDSFRILIEFMDTNPSVGMCIPGMENEKGELLRAYRKELTLFDMFNRMFLHSFFKNREAQHTMQFQDYTKPFDVPFGQGSFLLIKTELFKSIGGFDDNFFMYLEDADLCKRVNQISKLQYCPYTTLVHKWEKGSHKNLHLLKIHIISTFIYFKKWGVKLF